MPAGPKCLRCGSPRMGYAGFVTFFWRGNRWVPKRSSQEMAEGNHISCDDCGQTHTIWSLEPPFDLELITDMEILRR